MTKITEVNDENSQVYMFPTAFIYVTMIKKQLEGINEGQSVSDRLKEMNWSFSTDGKGTQPEVGGETPKFNFYMPRTLHPTEKQ